MHESLYQNLNTYPSETAQNTTGIDWRLLARLTPYLVSIVAWVVWAAFLLIPTVYGLHYTRLYPTENNVMFILTGLVLVIACSSALGVGHVGRSIAFAVPVFVLAYWF